MRLPQGVAFGLSAGEVLASPENQQVLAIARVAQAVEHLAMVEETLGDEIAAARDAGVSWAVLGDLVGLTGEGARQRYAWAVEQLSDDVEG